MQIELYNFFIAQLYSTPSHWYCYAIHQKINEHTVKDFPIFAQDQPIKTMFHKQETDWVSNSLNWAHSLKAVKLPSSVQYLDEQEYKVF